MTHDKSFKVWYFVGTAAIIVLLLINFLPNNQHSMSMDEMRESFISIKDDIKHDLLSKGDYKCCLDKPCTYCIEKTPGHGEGAICSCLEDVMNGVHPCGECIGEILEGHGNKYIANYFATAISEKTGEKEAIQRIIEEKYGVPIADQI